MVYVSYFIWVTLKDNIISYLQESTMKFPLSEILCLHFSMIYYALCKLVCVTSYYRNAQFFVISLQEIFAQYSRR